MTKARFSGFPTGSTVTISTLKDGVAKGPLTSATWKQVQAGNITFDLYSLHGEGQSTPHADRGNHVSNFTQDLTKEIAQDDVIELRQFSGIGMIVENVQGATTTDYRDLHFEIDFGERWDAEFLTHEYLPTGFTTRAPDGPEMGLYPSFQAGHVYRGTDMNKNEVLTKDYDDGDGKPVGIKDYTVTVTVTDGINTGTKTFTVRLINWLRFYTDVTGTLNAGTGTNAQTYGLNIYRAGKSGSEREMRRGVIYMSRDGDFTGAEVGANIYHVHTPSGDIHSNWFDRDNINYPADWTIYDTETATQFIGGIPHDASNNPVPSSSNFTFWHMEPNTWCILFKGGETYFPTSSITEKKIIKGMNGMISSWGTGRATWDNYEKTSKFSPLGGDVACLLYDSAEARGTILHKLILKASDYTNADPEWTEWWNILYYTNKSAGDFTLPTIISYPLSDPDGEFITNAGQTAWTRIVADFPTDATSGYLMVRQVVDTGGSDYFQRPQPATFTDGETLTCQSSGITFDFVAAGSRQDRTKKIPGAGISGTGTGEYFTVDNVEILGPSTAIGSTRAPWVFRSDLLIRDPWNYAMTAYFQATFHNGVVTVQPSTWQGQPFVGEVKDTGSVQGGNRNTWNGTKDGLATVPSKNNIAHSCYRISWIGLLTFHKCGGHWYGGHTDATDYANDVYASLPTKGGAQPFRRSENIAATPFGGALSEYGCFFSGGDVNGWNMAANETAVSIPPFWMISDLGWYRASEITTIPYDYGYTRSEIRNSIIGWPTDVDLAPRAVSSLSDLSKVKYLFRPIIGDFELGLFPDPNLAPRFKNCEFVIGCGNMPQGRTFEWTTTIRDNDGITFPGSFVTINEPDSTPGTPALPSGNVDPIPV